MESNMREINLANHEDYEIAFVLGEVESVCSNHKICD